MKKYKEVADEVISKIKLDWQEIIYAMTPGDHIKKLEVLSSFNLTNGKILSKFPQEANQILKELYHIGSKVGIFLMINNLIEFNKDKYDKLNNKKIKDKSYVG